MRLSLDCIPCFQRQALQAMRFVTDDEKVQEEALRATMRELLSLPWEATPPELARRVHRLIRQYSRSPDPYLQVKKQSNEHALKIYPEMKKIVTGSADRLETAARLAIAGNIMDFGASSSFDLEATIRSILHKPLAINDIGRLREELGKAEDILYFLDNAGEAVFDRLFLETLLEVYPIRRVNFVVKGGPVLNDVTEQDAVEAGLADLSSASEVGFLKITNGDPGTGPSRRSPEVREWIQEHDVVISKGQGNYEEMSEISGIFFILMAKCPLIARDLKVKVGDAVIKRS